jgi:hypothetical protein
LSQELEKNAQKEKEEAAKAERLKIKSDHYIFSSKRVFIYL